MTTFDHFHTVIPVTATFAELLCVVLKLVHFWK